MDSESKNLGSNPSTRTMNVNYGNNNRRGRMSLKLGDRVTDSITGFSGIAVARCEYLYGCISIQVQPESLKEENGKPKECAWIDEQRLDKTSVARTGGPQMHPSERERP